MFDSPQASTSFTELSFTITVPKDIDGILDILEAYDTSGVWVHALDTKDLILDALMIPTAGTWKVRALFPLGYDVASLQVSLASLGVLDAWIYAPLLEKDWLSENMASFAPFATARFWIHPPTTPLDSMPLGLLSLTMDASRAFGTGRHETTAMLLDILDDFCQQGHSLSSFLDMGTGSGILSFAALRLFPDASIVAVDNDCDAIAVAQSYGQLNGFDTTAIDFRCADGYGALDHGVLFDCILSNILATPLCHMAPRASAHVRVGGFIVLSGFLRQDVAKVLNAHQDAGFSHVDTQYRGDWASLILIR